MVIHPPGSLALDGRVLPDARLQFRPCGGPASRHAVQRHRHDGTRVAEQLREASLAAFDSLVDLCLERRAAFLVVAGDIYDGPERGLRAQLRFRDGLARLSAAGIPSFVVHGNHDPVETGWSALGDTWPELRARSSAPERSGPSRSRSTESRLATVQGISFAQRSERENLALRFARGRRAGPPSRRPALQRPGGGLRLRRLQPLHARRPAEHRPRLLGARPRAHPDDPLRPQAFGRALGRLPGQPPGPQPQSERARAEGRDGRARPRRAGRRRRAGRLRRRALRRRAARHRRDRRSRRAAWPARRRRPGSARRGRGPVARAPRASWWARASCTSTSVVPDRCADLLVALREDFDDDEPFCWWDSIDDRSRPAIDLDEVRAGSDFAADLVALADELSHKLADEDGAAGRTRRSSSPTDCPAPLRQQRALERLLDSAERAAGRARRSGPRRSRSASSTATGAEAAEAAMRISGFHIEGFGGLSDFGIDDLSPGLVIVSGPNEAGKSTLLDFLTAMLFGFPSRRDHPRFRPPVRGGRHGGQLDLVRGSWRPPRLGEDRRWQVERYASPKKDVEHPALRRQPRPRRRICAGHSAVPTRRCSARCSPST